MLLFFCAICCAEWGPAEVHNLLIKRVQLKTGVYTGKLDAAMDSAGLVVVAEYHKVMGDSYRPTITSANDYGKHARRPKHYENKALDFRISDVPRNKRSQLVASIRQALGKRFNVFWEEKNTANEHLHIELKE